MINDISARYEQAQKLMQGVLTNNVVKNDAVLPHWIDDSCCFWYIRETHEGKEFRIVDAKASTNTSAFDHQRLSEELTREIQSTIDHKNLPISSVTITLSPLRVCFKALCKHWLFEGNTILRENVPLKKTEGLLSPDKKNVIFLKEHNLWVRDELTGKEKALTHDGAEDYSYSTAANPNAFLADAVHALWSPDSKHILTYQLDTREVTTRPVVQYAPEDGEKTARLKQVKLAYPGDEHVESYRLLSIDVDTGQQRAAEYEPLPLWGIGQGFFEEEKLGWWSHNSRHAFFVHVARGANIVRVVEFDTHTGNTRVLIEETSDTFVKISHDLSERPVFLALPASNEVIWFSERNGWGHLYLYDLSTGEIKQPITEGRWLVWNILHYDPIHREILVQTAARDASVNPYYRDICKINIDSGELTSLVTGNYDYNVYQPLSFLVKVRMLLGLDSGDVNGISPCGRYLVTTRSRVDTAPVSMLIDRHGKELLLLETADVSGLPEDWHWPEPVKLKGADDQTDIYGVMYRPPGFSPDEHYPVLDYSCGMRSHTFIPHGSFANGPLFEFPYMTGAALAALGFVVIAIEGRGTPRRDKTFQDHNYGDVASTSDFNDRIAGIRQLAKQYPYMDLSRVGLTGLDNLASPVYGLLNHPDFYKVAVLHCFFEPRYAYAAPSEQYEGISINDPVLKNPTDAEKHIESLNGKLLLIQGMLDFATPSSTFWLVDALQKANKDFDMLCLPNVGHDVPSYALRRNWDYLVKNLQGVEPPKEFNLKTGLDFAMEALAEL